MKRSILLPAGFALPALLAVAPLSPAQANRPSGTVVLWGDNSFGQTDVPIAAQGGVVVIAAGSEHIVALQSDSSVLA